MMFRTSCRPVAFVLVMFAATSVCGQTYPTRPVRLLAPPPGGIADIAGRLVAQGISGPLAQQVIVDNRPGIIAIENAVKASPDGYTLLVFSPSMWLSPLLGTHVSYDPIADFAPITLAVSSPSIVAVHPALPVTSVKDLIALAKARPRELNYASGPSGGTPHLAAELFMSMARIKMSRIPYKGSAQGVIDLMAGNVQLMFAPASAMVQVRSGRLRALAVTSARPSVLAPGLPPVATILPGYEIGGVAAFFAPAGTPVTVVNRLNLEIVRVLTTVDVKEKLLNSGIETIASSPQQLAATIKSEIARMGKVIQEAGIRE